MAGKNRTFRTDILTHPKTAGLHPLDRDILLTQVVAANIAGVLQRSVAQIAKAAGGKTTQAQVRASLRRLEKRGIVRCWTDLELVWAIEAADNQGRTPNAWKGVVNAIEVLPSEVRSAFWARYSDRPGAPSTEGPNEGPSGGPSEGPTEGPARTGSRIEDRGSRNKDTGWPGRPSERASGTPPKTKADTEAELRHQAEHIVERIRWGEVPMPTPPGRRDALGFPTMNRSLLLDRLREGATADEVVATFGRLSARVSSGELPPEFWSGMALTGFYAALRDGLPIPGKSKPGLAPSSGTAIETVEAALAWSKEHDGRAPDGWEWHVDGRGGEYLLRAGGAA